MGTVQGENGNHICAGICTVRISKIPYTVVAEDLVEFLNTSISSNAVFACKIHTEKTNWKSKGYGFVQFETEGDAMKAVELARKCRLQFEGNMLEIEYEGKDIVNRQKISIRCKSLNVGCLANPAILSVLWSSKGEVTLELDHKKGKLAFLLDTFENDAKYKLTWRLKSLDISGSDQEKSSKDNFILLEMKHAPKIKRKFGSNKRKREKQFDRYTFFRENREEHEYPWQRCVDFTENGSIGKSSSCYIEISATDKEGYLGFTKNLIVIQAFTVIERNVTLRFDNMYSKPQGLIPLLGCSNLSEVPFSVIFKIYELVQCGILSHASLDDVDLKIFHPSTTPLPKTQMALQKLLAAKEPCYDLLGWFDTEIKLQQDKISKKVLTNSAGEGLMLTHHLTITPTRIYFYGPEVEMSNRVVRNHPENMENFLRVHFTDEDMELLHSKALLISDDSSNMLVKSKHTDVYYRVLRILREGIELGGRKFEFLAFSASQLREHSVWMFASNKTTTADRIRSWMGNFTAIRNVANCAARMGQCFSASKRGPDVYPHEIEEIPDIERQYGDIKYCFSDGIGMISPAFALEVASRCGYPVAGKAPSAFQIRYAGYKGVVAINPTATCKLSLRRSMRKFSSDLVSLDILEWSRFLPCYLNRQIITLLSTLGVEDRFFEAIQEERISSLNGLLDDRSSAVEVIQASYGGDCHKVVLEMLLAGYAPGCEPFLSSMLQAFKAAQIYQICKRSRIHISKGRILMGCLDETGHLSYGEVFIKVSSSDGNPSVLQGRVVVAKNPCLHPGDVRVLVAVDSPNLQHMVDCIVFPQNGDRPHPNECSGSDLDGDLYFVTWDERLIPPVTETPMDYHPPNPIILDHSPTLEEIQTYFVNYMQNDNLGTIANAHVVFADREPEKARSWQCKELALLSSISVDFPKTGVAAILPKYLRPHVYPDFMEKRDKKSYISRGVLGKLYRAAKMAAAGGDSLKIHADDVTRSYDKDLVQEGFERHLVTSLEYKKLYNARLRLLMDLYGVETEAEMVSGFFSELHPAIGNYSKRNSDPRKVEDKIHDAMKALRSEARSWYDDMIQEAKHSTARNEQYAIASSWYHVTYHPDFVKCQGDDDRESKTPFLSFPWVLYDRLLAIKRNTALKKWNQTSNGVSPNKRLN